MNVVLGIATEATSEQLYTFICDANGRSENVHMGPNYKRLSATGDVLPIGINAYKYDSIIIDYTNTPFTFITYNPLNITPVLRSEKPALLKNPT